MSNMLLYVEENLIFNPERCYGSDNETDSLEESRNIPLVSPQSTLGQRPFRPPPGFNPSAESHDIDDVLQDAAKQQFLQNASKSMDLPTFGAKKPNTNPFLQDEAVYDQYGQNLSPQQFIELWSENLHLQMQITATFNALLSSVMGNSAPDAKNAIKSGYEAETNLPNETFLFPDETVAAGGNLMNASYTERNSFAVPPVTANCSDNTNSLFAEVEYQNECNSTGKHVELFNSLNTRSFPNSHHESSAKDINAPYSGPKNFTHDKYAFDRRDNVPNDAENGYVETNPFKLSLAGKLRISESTEDITHNCADPLSSTPNTFQSSADFRFKEDHRHDGKLKNTSNDISTAIDSHKDSSAVCESIRKLINREFPSIERSFSFRDENVDELCESFKQHGDYVPPDYAWKSGSTEPQERANCSTNNDRLNNIHLSTDNSSKWGSYDIFSYSFLPSRTDVRDHAKDQTRTGDLNSEPYIPLPGESITSTNYNTIGSEIVQKMQRPIGHNSREAPNFSSTFQESCNHDVARENSPSASNYGLSNVTSASWSPINNSMPSLITINPNVDEGYITRPSTSHTSQSVSPAAQQTLPTWTTGYEVSAKGRPETANSSTQSMETVLENCSLATTFHRLLEEIRSHLPARSSEVERDITRNGTSETKTRGFGTKGSYALEGNEYEEFWRSSTSEISKPRQRLFSRAIELSRGTVHIFHYKEEGWLLTDEFVKAFTEFKTAGYMISLLHILNVHFSFAEIDGSESPIEISEFESTMRKSSWKVESNFSKMHLMPLKSILKVLWKLGMVTAEEVDRAIAHKENVNGTVIHEVLMVIDAYGEFKRLIEVPQ